MASTAGGVDAEALVMSIVEHRPLVGFAVGIVHDGDVGFASHGLADIDSRSPVTEDTVFRIASITKTFTAIAVMQLWERGLVELDAPVNDYLRSYRLVAADEDWRPATVRHLLTHTAGLAEVAHFEGVFQPDFGESYEAGSSVPNLADFYRGDLMLHAEPGTRFVYNNHGPATLGQLVEDVSGSRLREYFGEHVFEPLGMTDTDLIRSDRVRKKLATGYEIRARGVSKVAERDMVTAGAAAIYSTPRDMVRYVQALLGEGRGPAGSILEPETLAVMFQPHYQPDPRIPGMGLGFFRKSLRGHTAVRHQGTHPGFHSELCVVPDAGVGVVAFTNGARQADLWLPGSVSAHVGRTLDDEQGPDPVAHSPELWADLCGWYRLSARLSDIRLRGMLGAGAEVFVRSGQLMIRFLTPIPALAAGIPLIPDQANDPFVFRIDLAEEGLEPIRVVFGQASDGATDRLFLDVMPLALSKQPASTNPRKWVAGILAVLGLGAVAATDRRRRTR